MAISFVGSATGLVTATDTTVAFSALLDASGATPTVLQNDIVIVTVSRRSAGTSAPALTSTGYASIYASIFANSTDDTNLISFFKVMGATPDTSVVITGPGSTQVESYCVHVLRGVDTTTPFDGVTPTTSTGIGAGSPNAPAITPATAGAWIMACGGAAGPNTVGQTTVLTNPANLDATTNFFRSTAGTRTSTGAGIFSGWTSGSFDPATFGGGAQNASGSFAAATFAIRPAATGTTVALTGQAVTAAGGTLAPAVTFATAGQSLSAAQGQVLQGAPLVGQILTAAQGSTLAVVSIALSGQSLSAALGTTAATSSSAITGQSLAAAQGSVVASPSLALTGQPVAVTRGLLLASTSLSLTGQPLTVAEGTVTPAAGVTSVALIGQSISVAQGSVVAQPSLALSGHLLAAVVNTLTPTASFTLAGQAITTTAEPMSLTFSAVLPGQALALGQSVVALMSNVALTGQDVAALLSSLSVSSGIPTIITDRMIIDISTDRIVATLPTNEIVTIDELENEAVLPSRIATGG